METDELKFDRELWLLTVDNWWPKRNEYLGDQGFKRAILHAKFHYPAARRLLEEYKVALVKQELQK